MAGRGPRPSFRVPLSRQDEVLAEHFFSFVTGAGEEFGRDGAQELRAILARARRRGEAASFGTFVARLMIAYDAEYQRALHGPRIATEGSAS